MENATHYSSRKYSPSWVKQGLDDRIGAAVSKIEHIFAKAGWEKIHQGIAALLLAGLYVTFFYVVTLNPYFNNNKTSFFEARFFWIIPSLVPLVLITDIVAALLGFSQKVAILCCSAVTLVAIPEVLSYGNHSYFPSLVRLSLIFALSFHTGVLLFTRHLKFSTRLLLFFAAEIVMILYLALHAGFEFYSESFWISQPYRYLFMFTILSAEIRGENPSQFLDVRYFTYILNPTNLITPLPIHYRDWVPAHQNNFLKSKAVVHLVFGFLALIAAAFMQKLQHNSWIFHHGDIGQIWFYGGPASYLYVFCYSYANITIPVSLAWWFGFKIPDAYDMPLLATTPQDRWRRWNFLFYDWYFRFVFFPVFKFTKNQFLAVMLTFTATLFIHLGPMNSQIFRSIFDEPLSHHFLRKTAFFVAHGLLVYFGMKFQKHLPNPDKISGWIGVVAMFLIMSIVHYIYMI